MALRHRGFGPQIILGGHAPMSPTKSEFSIVPVSDDRHEPTFCAGLFTVVDRMQTDHEVGEYFWYRMGCGSLRLVQCYEPGKSWRYESGEKVLGISFGRARVDHVSAAGFRNSVLGKVVAILEPAHSDFDVAEMTIRPE